MKAGILGGGQLGRMLLQEAANYPVETWVMEKDGECPAAHLCHHFVQGDIRDFDAVYSFGQQVDVLTIEIENVTVEALEKLESEGKTMLTPIQYMGFWPRVVIQSLIRIRALLLDLTICALGQTAIFTPSHKRAA